MKIILTAIKKNEKIRTRLQTHQITHEKKRTYSQTHQTFQYRTAFFSETQHSSEKKRHQEDHDTFS